MRTLRLVTSYYLMVLLSACAPSPDTEDTVQLNNDELTLASRVTYQTQTLALEPITKPLASISHAPAASDVVLTLVAEVLPPSILAHTLQANEVVIQGNRAYVTYNTSGELFYGGVEIFDISNVDRPTLISSLLFSDTDVNGVAINENDLLLASATSRDTFASPAILQVIGLSSGKLTTGITEHDIASWAATDIDVASSHVYVTSGAAGGYVTILDKQTYAVEQRIAVEDARGIDADANSVAVVAGTNARLLGFDRTLATQTSDYSLTGATIPYSKSTVEVKGGVAVLALGDGGTQLVCLANGSVLHTIAPPVVTGLSSAVTVTNAATAFQRTLFMSNGEAGIYVARTTGAFNDQNCNIGTTTVVGSLRFSSFQSINHVVYRGNLLFIAGGLGGLKIVKVDTSDTDVVDLDNM